MAAQPEPWKSLRSELEKMREQLRALYNRSPFFGTGMHANGVGGLDSDNFVAGTSGFSLAGTAGNLEVNDITLRGGIIGNDALSNPVSADINGGNGVGMSVTTTQATKATTSLTVPPGFTKALVRADALGEAVNSTASADYMYVQSFIQGTGGGEMYTVAQPGFGASAVGIANRLLTGLSSGDTVTCEAVSRTQAGAWAASGGNLWIIHMQVIWLR